MNHYNKIGFTGLLLSTILSSSFVYAGTNEGTLIEERKAAVRQYIDFLGQGNADEMKKLFANNGIVVSTSRGKVNAAEFFDSFLPLIQVGNTQIHEQYFVDSGLKHYGARFHFDFVLTDGEQGGGEYVDEFVFAYGSAKLQAVYMFENLKFPDNALL